jgi:hypothetical protein
VSQVTRRPEDVDRFIQAVSIHRSFNMHIASVHRLAAWAFASSLALAAASAGATVSAVGPGDFPGSSLLVDLSTLADGVEVNGLSVDGLTFGYSLGDGHVIIDGGPGVTGNVTPPNIVSIGSLAGVLGVSLPGPSLMFGYGFALLADGTLPDGTTISLFDGVTSVGSLTYVAAPDPTFPGGFAGISSTLPFDRVELTFNGAALAFAADNFRVSAVPEPATLGLFALGIVAVLLRRQRQAG